MYIFHGHVFAHMVNTIYPLICIEKDGVESSMLIELVSKLLSLDIRQVKALEIFMLDWLVNENDTLVILLLTWLTIRQERYKNLVTIMAMMTLSLAHILEFIAKLLNSQTLANILTYMLQAWP